MRTTHTYAVLEISPAAYAEIRGKLRDAGYTDQFQRDRDHGEVIDMYGIALTPDASALPQAGNPVAKVNRGFSKNKP